MILEIRLRADAALLFAGEQNEGDGALWLPAQRL